MSIICTAWQKVAFMQEEFKPFIEEYYELPEVFPIIDEYCNIIVNQENDEN